MQYVFTDSYGDVVTRELPTIGVALIVGEHYRLRRRWTNGDWSFSRDYMNLIGRFNHSGGVYYYHNGYMNFGLKGYALAKTNRKIREMNNLDTDDYEQFECEQCSCDTPIDDAVVIGDHGYCTDCVVVCEHCDEHTLAEDAYNDGHTVVCPDCYSDCYCTCEDCDRIINSDYINCVSSDTYVCQSCVERGDYRYCEIDGEWHYSDCSCDGCCEEDESSIHIHSYGYEPDTMFHDDRDIPHMRPKRREFYFGAEIEMNTRQDWSDVHEAAEFVVGNISSDLVYLKEDSSIGTGFEFVTHPMTLDYWRDKFPWDTYEKLADMNMLAWNSVGRKCGLHINISRAAFVAPSHLSKFLLFVYRNEDELVKFAGRRSEDYANFTYSERKLFVQHGKGDTYGMRHVAVNCQNSNRIEFRIFRPSLKRDTIISTIELCHALAHFTSIVTCNDVYNNRLTFDGFVEWLKSGDTPTTYERLLSRIDKRVYGHIDQAVSA